MPGNVESPHTSSPARHTQKHLNLLLAARGLLQKLAAYIAAEPDAFKRLPRHMQGRPCLCRGSPHLGRASLAQGMCPGLP